MDKTRTRIGRLSDPVDPLEDYVPGTASYRVELVWELTKELCAVAGLDAESPMRRDVTRVLRGVKRGGGAPAPNETEEDPS